MKPRTPLSLMHGHSIGANIPLKKFRDTRP